MVPRGIHLLRRIWMFSTALFEKDREYYTAATERSGDAWLTAWVEDDIGWMRCRLT